MAFSTCRFSAKVLSTITSQLLMVHLLYCLLNVMLCHKTMVIMVGGISNYGIWYVLEQISQCRY